MSNDLHSRIEIALDGEDGGASVTAGPDHSTAQLRRVLKELEARGLVPIDGDEEPEEILEDGSIRIWFVQSGAKVTTIATLARKAGKQLATAGAAAALITVGVQGTQMAMADPVTYETSTGHHIVIENGEAFLVHPEDDKVHPGHSGQHEALKPVENDWDETRRWLGQRAPLTTTPTVKPTVTNTVVKSGATVNHTPGQPVLGAPDVKLPEQARINAPVGRYGDRPTPTTTGKGKN